MKWLNGYRTKMVLVGCVAVIVLGGGRTKADFTFGEPMNLGPTVNSSANEQAPSISTDGLEFYFTSDRPGGLGQWDLWVATRETTSDSWGEPMNLGPIVNSSRQEWGTFISADGLELYFRSDGPSDWADLYVTRRATRQDKWTEPVSLGLPVNTSNPEWHVSITPDGLQLYFGSNRPGGYGEFDIYVATRESRDDPWGEPVNLGPIINTPGPEGSMSIAPGGLLLFFNSYNRPGGYGKSDLYMTKRKTKDDPWTEAVNLGPTINTVYMEYEPNVSSDGRTLYFADYFYLDPRPGGHGGSDLWQAPIIPIVDLNGDGIVDAEDMCIMVDHWGTDEPLCDIGPMPWGDGVVDVQDLIVLAEHLFEEFPPAQ